MCQTLDGALWREPWMSQTGPCPSRDPSPSHGFGTTLRVRLCADAVLLAPTEPVSTSMTCSHRPRPVVQELVPIQQNRVACGAQVPTPACKRHSGICHHFLPVSAGRLCQDLLLGVLESNIRFACYSFYKAKLPSLPPSPGGRVSLPGTKAAYLVASRLAWPGAC